MQATKASGSSYRIVLITPPFASILRPSFALTQLKAIAENFYPEQVSVEIIYLNQDFAHYIGIELYQEIAEGIHYNTGLGDWFFRQIAFPELTDNAKEYYQRFYPQVNAEMQAFKQFIQHKRKNLEQYLKTLIAKYRLDQADLIGFTSMFSQNVACFALARTIKKYNAVTVTIMGGANCEPPMGQEIIRLIPSIDFAFSGPGLRNFAQFIQYSLFQRSNACHTLDGVFSKKYRPKTE